MNKIYKCTTSVPFSAIQLSNFFNKILPQYSNRFKKHTIAIRRKTIRSLLKTIKSTKNKSLREDCNVSHHILKNIQNFDFKIDFVFKEYSTGNGSFVFHSISYLINTLYASIMIFKEYANKYKVHYLKNELNAMFNTLELIEKEFNKKRSDLDMCYTDKNRFKVIIILIDKDLSYLSIALLILPFS